MSIERLVPLLEAANIELSELLAQLEMPPDTPAEAFSGVDILRLLELYAVKVQDETWHMSTRPLLPGTNNFVLAQLQQCSTVKDVLEQLAKAYNFIHGGNYNRLEIRQRELVYVIDDTGFPYLPTTADETIAFNLNCVLLYVHGILCSLVSESLPLLKIETKASEAVGGALLADFSETQVHYLRTSYALHYPIDVAVLAIEWQERIPLTSAQVYAELHKRMANQQLAARSTVLAQVREAVACGMSCQTELAAQMGCSVATLRRRLASYGTSFRMIREHVLNQQAQVLLAQGLTLDAIAQELGFADSRSFSRAYKSWNGCNPRGT